MSAVTVKTYCRDTRNKLLYTVEQTPARATDFKNNRSVFNVQKWQPHRRVIQTKS
jgi:hypothetical protein